MKVLMISGDVGVIKNIDGPFSLTLRELAKYWDQIDVLCPGIHGHERQFKTNVRLKGARKFLLFLDLFRLFRKERYDLVVTHDYGLMLNGLSAFFLTKLFRIPQISEIHHLEGFPTATNAKEKFYARWGKAYIKFFVKNMRAVRVDNLGDIVPLLKSLGVPDKKIVYLPPIYLDLDIYKPLKIEKKIDVLFVGRLATNKGIFTILTAVKNLKTKGIKLRTNIKGKGPLRKDVLSFIAENSLADLVSLDERILNEAELVQLYNESRVLVCASTVEGGPRVTLEAMACNVPVISTPCGIMPEVIINGRNGYLFDGSVAALEKQLIEIFEQISNQSTEPLEARKSVEKYDLNITLKSYGTSYRKLLEDGEPI